MALYTCVKNEQIYHLYFNQSQFFEKNRYINKYTHYIVAIKIII